MGKSNGKKRLVVPVELVRYMEKQGLSQQQLADKLGVSQGLVWQWLNGETSITPERAKDIEEITDIPRIQLLYPEERVA